MDNLENQQLTLYEGEEKTFSLNGKSFTVPARFDAHNYYRKKFRELAMYYTDKASKEYMNSVCDLDTFFQNAVDIYVSNLNGIVDKAIDILVSDDIFDCSDEIFIDAHKSVSCMTMEYFAEVENHRQKFLEKSADSIQGISNIAGSLLGQKSWILGDFVSGLGEGMAENVTLSDVERRALFVAIKPHRIFNLTFEDYWLVYNTLIFFLRKNGRDVWTFDEVYSDEVDTTIRLLAKPNFPKDKVADLILNLIPKDPYRKEIYDVMREKFGDIDEVLNILDYFGFMNFTSEIYKEEDFPTVAKEESETVNTNKTEDVNKEESGALTTEFKEAVGSVLKTAKESDFTKSVMKKFGLKK